MKAWLVELQEFKDPYLKSIQFPKLNLFLAIVYYSPHGFIIRTPIAECELLYKPFKFNSHIKIGRAWHDLIWDAKKTESLTKHICEYSFPNPELLKTKKSK